MVGRVGYDAFGPILLEILRSEGIDESGVALDTASSTGIAMILVEESGENRIIAVYGANMACGAEQVEAMERVIEGADALMLQLEVPIDVSLEAARYARSRGVRVVMDPAPAAELPHDAYSLIDVITPNQTEAESLTGVEVSGPEGAKLAAEVLLERGAGVVVVKMGKDGVYYASKNEQGYVTAFEVEVRDTVAAGDAFGAALTVALSEGMGLADAVRFGAAAGALAVTKSGAQEAMPHRKEVDSLFRS
jgi:ribokinase